MLPLTSPWATTSKTYEDGRIISITSYVLRIKTIKEIIYLLTLKIHSKVSNNYLRLKKYNTVDWTLPRTTEFKEEPQPAWSTERRSSGKAMKRVCKWEWSLSRVCWPTDRESAAFILDRSLSTMSTTSTSLRLHTHPPKSWENSVSFQ